MPFLIYFLEEEKIHRSSWERESVNVQPYSPGNLLPTAVRMGCIFSFYNVILCYSNQKVKEICNASNLNKHRKMKHRHYLHKRKKKEWPFHEK